jgi:NTP pyrophosphatase (non-canonical NTP hydrolase)
MNKKIIIEAIQKLVNESYALQLSKQWPERSIGEDIALMHSELSEALEEFRDGHNPREVYYATDADFTGVVTAVRKPEGMPIELADVLIRIFAFCGQYDIQLGDAILTKMEFNKTRPVRHGGKKI